MYGISIDPRRVMLMLPQWGLKIWIKPWWRPWPR